MCEKRREKHEKWHLGSVLPFQQIRADSSSCCHASLRLAPGHEPLHQVCVESAGWRGQHGERLTDGPRCVLCRREHNNSNYCDHRFSADAVLRLRQSVLPPQQVLRNFLHVVYVRLRPSRFFTKAGTKGTPQQWIIPEKNAFSVNKFTTCTDVERVRSCGATCVAPPSLVSVSLSISSSLSIGSSRSPLVRSSEAINRCMLTL